MKVPTPTPSDYCKPRDEIDVDGRPYVRQPDDLRYRYGANKILCPVCGSLGRPMHGWFTCAGAAWCNAVALIDTGEVFRPRDAFHGATDQAILPPSATAVRRPR